MTDKDISLDIQQRIEQAVAHKTPLAIRCGNSKAFYGRAAQGEVLDVSSHRGVVNYEPSELVITVRAGTRLRDLENFIAQEQQCLPFEPPHFGDNASIGGTLACNFSGSSRPFSGAARDFVLGCKVINGKGEVLRFGGEVMKNVAGYDVSRLMCGALGTLGVLLEVSVRVLPKPEVSETLVYELSDQDALAKAHAIAAKSFPMSGSVMDGERLYVRLSGSTRAVAAARKSLGGDTLANADPFWQQIKEQQYPFFNTNRPLWRVSLASNAPVLDIAGQTLYEWNGAQRWLITDEEEHTLRDKVNALGGQVGCFKHHPTRDEVFHPLAPGIARLHRNLKHAFDPHAILNPGRMYSDI